MKLAGSGTKTVLIVSMSTSVADMAASIPTRIMPTSEKSAPVPKIVMKDPKGTKNSVEEKK